MVADVRQASLGHEISESLLEDVLFFKRETRLSYTRSYPPV